jgi:hypothetical protein
MKSLIQGFLTGTRGQARALAPRQVASPRFSRHLNTPREISPLWGRIPCLRVQVPPWTPTQVSDLDIFIPSIVQTCNSAGHRHAGSSPSRTLPYVQSFRSGVTTGPLRTRYQAALARAELRPFMSEPAFRPGPARTSLVTPKSWCARMTLDACPRAELCEVRLHGADSDRCYLRRAPAEPDFIRPGACGATRPRRGRQGRRPRPG